MISPLSDRAAIVGIGQTEFSKQLALSETQAAFAAIRAALEDAGLDAADIDGVCRYDIESTGEAELACGLGLRNIEFFSSHSHGGGGYCGQLVTAAAAIGAGLATTVLC